MKCIAFARSRYNFDEISIEADIVHSIKMDAIRSFLALINYNSKEDYPLLKIEQILLLINRTEIYKKFFEYENENLKYFLISYLYEGETAIYDFDVINERYIVSNDEECFRLFNDITIGTYTKHNLEELKNDFKHDKEVSEFLDKL